MAITPSPTLYAPHDWRTSTFSAGGQCVDVKIIDNMVMVRHSSGQGGVVEFTHPEWSAFIEGVYAGEFDAT